MPIANHIFFLHIVRCIFYEHQISLYRTLKQLMKIYLYFFQGLKQSNICEFNCDFFSIMAMVFPSMNLHTCMRGKRLKILFLSFISDKRLNYSLTNYGVLVSFYCTTIDKEINENNEWKEHNIFMIKTTEHHNLHNTKTLFSV